MFPFGFYGLFRKHKLYFLDWKRVQSENDFILKIVIGLNDAGISYETSRDDSQSYRCEIRSGLQDKFSPIIYHTLIKSSEKELRTLSCRQDGVVTAWSILFSTRRNVSAMEGAFFPVGMVDIRLSRLSMIVLILMEENVLDVFVYPVGAIYVSKRVGRVDSERRIIL